MHDEEWERVVSLWVRRIHATTVRLSPTIRWLDVLDDAREMAARQYRRTGRPLPAWIDMKGRIIHHHEHSSRESLLSS